MALVLFGVFFVLIILGAPIMTCLALSAAVAIVMYTRMPLFVISQSVISGANSFPMMAIPFFMLAGDIMARGGISKRLVNFAGLLVGGIIGGLAHITILASMIFAAISGSCVATTAAIGGIMIPEMKRQGYRLDFAAGTAAAAGCVGTVIPPSIPMVLYAVLANVSVNKLFLGGFGPGVLMGVLMMMVAYRTAKKDGVAIVKEKRTFKEIFHIFMESLWALLMPVIILGGIYSGVFTATESAVVAVFYGLFVSFFIYKELKLADLPNLLLNTAIGSAAVLVISSAAGAFSWALTSGKIPQLLANTMLSITDNKYVLLLLFNIVLLIAGCFLNASAAVTLLTPILLPLMVSVGVNPLMVGIIMVVNLSVGQVTPPVGPTLYVATNLSNVPFENVVRNSMPYLIVLVISILLTTYIEPIVMFLPTIFG